MGILYTYRDCSQSVLLLSRIIKVAACIVIVCIYSKCTLRPLCFSPLYCSHLGLYLPHTVDHKSGKAKWLSEEELLEITLRIVREYDFLNKWIRVHEWGNLILQMNAFAPVMYINWLFIHFCLLLPSSLFPLPPPLLSHDCVHSFDYVYSISLYH